MKDDDDPSHFPEREPRHALEFVPLMLHGVRTRLVLGYLSVLTLLAICAVATILVTRQVHAGYRHTVQIDDPGVAQVMLRVKLMDDEETGIRGYLLTENPVFLQPYIRARSALPTARRRSQWLLAHEPRIIPLLATMTRRAAS